MVKNKFIKKDIIKVFVLGIIIGGIIFSGISVVAITLTANEISYTSSESEFTATNVKSAIDELYKISQENTGTQKVVDLGTGTSFDLTSYEGYQNFTNSNFIIVSASSMSNSGSSSFQPGYSASVNSTVTASYSTTKSYNASSGILTAYATLSGSFSRAGGVDSGRFPSFSSNEAVNVYLIY